jgi:hypothetical protein
MSKDELKIDKRMIIQPYDSDLESFIEKNSPVRVIVLHDRILDSRRIRIC